jgi:GT2 family glycosyltransferase/Tfp pilus assembly protein PilF
MRYLIVAPSYDTKSAGIKVLYELQKWLVRFGKDAQIHNWELPCIVSDDDIVVYPEIIAGNPYNAKRVVRYILNEPGYLGGDKQYDKDDILFAYDGSLAQFTNNSNNVLRMPCIEEFFVNTHCERVTDCYWVGKGKDTNHPAVKDAVEITYTWPVKRRELAALFNRTKTFYTYDDRTALTLEASLCGCEIKEINGGDIVDIRQMVPFDLQSLTIQLDNFIQMTWYPEMDSSREAADYIDAIISCRMPTLTPLSNIPNLTSIIVLIGNSLEYTKNCLASIRAHTKIPYEIIFVDDGAYDGTAEWLQAEQDPCLRVIADGNTSGFARSSNLGLQAASGSYFVLLQNDAVLTPGWLTRMHELLVRYPNAGIVGPMTNSASGVQMVADIGSGSLIELPARAAIFCDDNRYRVIRQRHIDGFCMLFRRELVETIGLLDGSFGTDTIENEDYCLRAELAGYHNMIAGDVFVHNGGATFAGDRTSHADAMEQNTALYRKKWENNSLNESILRRLLSLDAIIEARRLAMSDEREEAIKHLVQKGISVTPDYPTPYIELTEILMAAGRHDDALQMVPKMPPTTDRSVICEIEAICHAALSDDEAALSAASKVQDRPRALVVLGTLAARGGDLAEAEARFRGAIEADPSSGAGWLSLGMLLWGLGEQDDAWQAMQRSVVVDPLNCEAVKILRDMAERVGRTSEVARLIKAAAKTYPDSRNLARHHATLLAQCGQSAEALATCEMSLVHFGADDTLLPLALELRSRIAESEETLTTC